MAVYRRMLLDVLTENPGSVEVEKGLPRQLPELARRARPENVLAASSFVHEIEIDRRPPLWPAAGAKLLNGLS